MVQQAAVYAGQYQLQVFAIFKLQIFRAFILKALKYHEVLPLSMLPY